MKNKLIIKQKENQIKTLKQSLKNKKNSSTLTVKENKTLENSKKIINSLSPLNSLNLTNNLIPKPKQIDYNPINTEEENKIDYTSRIVKESENHILKESNSRYIQIKTKPREMSLQDRKPFLYNSKYNPSDKPISIITLSKDPKSSLIKKQNR
jgi:hypothetical protein